MFDLSERLLFRELKEEDALVWTEFTSDKESMKNFPAFDNPLAKAKEWVALQQERYQKDGWGLYALILKSTNELVGQCGLLTQVVDGVRELEIGYHLLPRHRKQGYATEAAKAFKEYAFDRDLATSLISIIHIENVLSQKVATRNGMMREKQSTFKGMPVYIYRVNAANSL